jgi:hypothetical protein
LGDRRRADSRVRGTWASAALLFLYAVPFSFAYVSLCAGTGALVLFGAVQSTMLAWALATGARPWSRSGLGSSWRSAASSIS